MHRLERHWQSLTPVSLALLPLSWLYRLAMAARRSLYRLGLLRRERLPVPVIVVGNITTGGTGKTPLVIRLAAILRRAGYRPGIISRGYGGRARTWPQEVAPDSDPDLVGDEAVLLARRSGCPVVVGPDRVADGRKLLGAHDCNVLLCDDGLQHYALERDIEIVVIDGNRRFGNGRCLPAGPLREPLSRLNGVDARVTTGHPGPGEFGMKIVAQGFHRLDAPDKVVEAEYFHGRPVHALAGIGNPARFFIQLREMGLEVIEHAFPDHHRYTRDDLRKIGTEEVIMTEKDAVKCEQFAGPGHWYLAVEARPDQRLGEMIVNRLGEKPSG